MLMSKKDLREYVKNEISRQKAILQQKSEEICRNILTSENYKNADFVLAYMALPDEVNLSAVIDRTIKDEKKVFLPRIIPGTNFMDFYEFTDNTKTGNGSFGIVEPDENSNKLEIKKYLEKILILTPGRAFTINGDRLGRGKGFYDIFLSKLLLNNCKNIKIAGVCFDFQIVDFIPTEEHDLKMDFLYHD